MKKIFALFMSFAILLQVMAHVGIGVYYHLNKAYITEKLCENKNNPKLHCNGQCYLSKQLKKAEEAERKQAQSVIKEKEELIADDEKIRDCKYFPSYIVTGFLHECIQVCVFVADDALVKPPTV